jgi:hypothetical protein
MAVQQQIDWPGIRAAAVAIGVRAAARRAGADLPPDEQKRFVDRVMQRSAREKWLAIRHETPKQGGEKPLSANVSTGFSALASELAQMENETKHGLARAAMNMTKKSINAPLKQAGNVHKVAQTAAIVHGWNTDRREGDVVEINMLSIGGNVDLGRREPKQASDE